LDNLNRILRQSFVVHDLKQIMHIAFVRDWTSMIIMALKIQKLNAFTVRAKKSKNWVCSSY